MNYSLLKDAYFGTGGFANGAYLTRYKRESDKDYQFRRANAYYPNYFAPIVNALVDPIFKRAPLRDYDSSIDEIVQDFLQDVDGGGTDIDTFMKRTAIMAKIYGVAFIIVDMVRDASAQNLMDVRKRRIYPYLRVAGPQEINGNMYGLDSRGNLTYIEFREIAKINDGAITYRYCYYGLDGWHITGDESIENSRGEYQLGRVPIIPVFSRMLEQKTMLPESDMSSIATMAKALYNHCSWLSEILRNQTFPILTIPTLDAAELTIGNNNALGYAQDSTHEPNFIAPPSGPAQVLQTQISTLVQEMYRMASLSYLQSESSKSSSGIARQWEFERTNQQLANFAMNIGKAEEAVMQVFAHYLNTEINYTVTYPDDFGVVDVEDDLKQAQEVLDLGLTNALKEEVLKKVLSAYCPNLSDERFDEIMQSLKQEEEDRKNAEQQLRANLTGDNEDKDADGNEDDEPDDGGDNPEDTDDNGE